jgi:hypothetical protein
MASGDGSRASGDDRQDASEACLSRLFPPFEAHVQTVFLKAYEAELFVRANEVAGLIVAQTAFRALEALAGSCWDWHG